MRATTARYAITSAGCLCLHNIILIASDRAGVTMFQSASISFCIMVVVGYGLLASTVFRHVPTLRGFCRYTSAMALSFPLATFFLWVVLKLLGRPMAIAAPSAAISMAAINFFMSRWAVTGRMTWIASSQS